MARVVLIHGLFGPFADDRTWSRLQSHQIVVPDMLGYGREVSTDRTVTLETQVEYLRDLLGPERVHLVGHSVGGVIAMLYAHRYPDDVQSIVSVEGNFGLGDAFWSSEIAGLAPADVAALLEQYRTDPAGWFGADSPREVESARMMLDFQPAATLHSMAASVVAITGASGWETLLREVFSRTEVHLIAGETSRSSWHLPEWALQQARSYAEVRAAGHAMMFQQPAAFADALVAALEPS